MRSRSHRPARPAGRRARRSLPDGAPETASSRAPRGIRCRPDPGTRRSGPWPGDRRFRPWRACRPCSASSLASASAKGGTISCSPGIGFGGERDEVDHITGHHRRRLDLPGQAAGSTRSPCRSADRSRRAGTSRPPAPAAAARRLVEHGRRVTALGVRTFRAPQDAAALLVDREQERAGILIAIHQQRVARQDRRGAVAEGIVERSRAACATARCHRARRRAGRNPAKNT